MTEVIIVERCDEAGEIIASHIAEQVTESKRFVLGLATGTSPLPVYRALASRVRMGLSLRHVTCFALDEYVGLPDGHPQSYATVVNRDIAESLGLDPNRVHVPDGSMAGIQDAGERFESLVQASGGIDLQLLGIGANGHLAFNEPGSSLGSRTRLKTLSEQTRRDNARFFSSPDEVPRYAMTQGIGTILQARHLVLLAFGTGKAAAVAAAIEGPVTSAVPASAVQLHPHSTVVINHDAASKLAALEYYLDVQRHKPDWQGL